MQFVQAMKDSQGAFVNTETPGIKGNGGNRIFVASFCAFPFPFFLFFLAVFLSSLFSPFFLLESSFGWIRWFVASPPFLFRVLVNGVCTLSIDKGEAERIACV